MLPFPVLLSVGVFSCSFFFWGKKIILGLLQSAFFFTLYSFIMPELFIYSYNFLVKNSALEKNKLN